VPVLSYLSKTSVSDDITPNGCTYASTYNNDHWNKAATYASVEDLILPILREPVGKAFSLSEEQRNSMNFVQLYEFSDVLLAENMEGSKPRYNFTSV
jgi:hypothetical protein